MFLRNLVVYNLCDATLVDALPTIAHWKRASCPDYLSKEEVEKLVVACNPVTAEGARDRAVLLLLVRLGLRAGDIVHLRHADIDWENGALQLTGKGPSTRNARLAAIKSFMHFLEYRVPSALEQLRQVLAIPFQKTDTRLVRHLTQAEMQAILDVPDPSTRDGVRDRAMLHLAFTGGLRVSELVGLKLNDVTFRAGYVDLRVMGKGRKERVLTLWKTVAGSLRAWLSIRGDASVRELFLNARAQPLTRSGFKHIVNKHFPAAVNKCPSLKTKRVSPHVLRHYLSFLTMSGAALPASFSRCVREGVPT